MGRDAIALTVDRISPPEVMTHLAAIAADPLVNPVDLASTVKNAVIEKYDQFLDAELLAWNYASSHLDVQATWSAVHQMHNRSSAAFSSSK